MELLQSRRFLFAVILSAAFIHVALLQGCDECYNEICNGASGSQCVFVDGSVTCDVPSCLVENSIVDCQNSDSWRLLSLDSTSPHAERCLDYGTRLNRTGVTGTPLSSGVYIIESFRSCTNQSIGKILLRTNSPSSTTNVEEFHIYKLYKDGRDTELFIRSTSFNVTLSYSEELNVLVAVPMTPTHADQGDYLGLTLPEDIEILTTVTSSTNGVYSVSSPIGQCHGSSLDVFEIDTNNIITRDPLISVEEEGGTSTFPTTPTTTTISTTPTSQTTPTKPTTSTTTTTPTGPITVIVGSAVGCGVVITAILIVVLTLCLYFHTKRIGLTSHPDNEPTQLEYPLSFSSPLSHEDRKITQDNPFYVTSAITTNEEDREYEIIADNQVSTSHSENTTAHLPVPSYENHSTLHLPVPSYENHTIPYTSQYPRTTNKIRVS